MALPWIIGAVVVGVAAWALSDSDDNRSSSSDRDDREREARRKKREAKREQLNREIEAFKDQEKKRIQQKYNAQIEFSEYGSPRIVKKDKSLENKIDALEDEQNELKQLINQLKKEQNATNK